MDERLTQEQRGLVEENLTVIDSVIKSCVHVNNISAVWSMTIFIRLGRLVFAKRQADINSASKLLFLHTLFMW